jgi:hypothetical protein
VEESFEMLESLCNGKKTSTSSLNISPFLLFDLKTTHKAILRKLTLKFPLQEKRLSKVRR